MKKTEPDGDPRINPTAPMTDRTPTGHSHEKELRSFSQANRANGWQLADMKGRWRIQLQRETGRELPQGTNEQ